MIKDIVEDKRCNCSVPEGTLVSELSELGLVETARYGTSTPELSDSRFFDALFMDEDVQSLVLSPTREDDKLVSFLSEVKIERESIKDFYYFENEHDKKFRILEESTKSLKYKDDFTQEMLFEDLKSEQERFQKASHLSNEKSQHEELVFGFSFRTQRVLDSKRAPHRHHGARLNHCKTYRGPGTILYVGDYPSAKWSECEVDRLAASLYLKGSQGWRGKSAQVHKAPDARGGYKAEKGRIALFQWSLPVNTLKQDVIESLLAKGIPR